MPPPALRGETALRPRHLEHNICEIVRRTKSREQLSNLKMAAHQDTTLADLLTDYVGQQVVLDTAGTIVFLGVLADLNEVGFWLDNADVHDCNEGHADKEAYVYEAKTQGVRTNRKRLFVMRSAVVSLSALEDAVQEDLEPQEECGS